MIPQKVKNAITHLSNSKNVSSDIKNKLNRIIRKQKITKILGSIPKK